MYVVRIRSSMILGYGVHRLRIWKNAMVFGDDDFVDVTRNYEAKS